MSYLLGEYNMINDEAFKREKATLDVIARGKEDRKRESARYDWVWAFVPGILFVLFALILKIT